VITQFPIVNSQYATWAYLTCTETASLLVSPQDRHCRRFSFSNCRPSHSTMRCTLHKSQLGLVRWHRRWKQMLWLKV